MTLLVYAESSNATFTEWANRIRWPGWEVTVMAEECAAGSSSIEFEDTSANFYIYGHRLMYFKETEAEGDDYFGIIGPFVTGTRTIARGDERTGSRRRWKIELRDVNALLAMRVQKGGGQDRPEETDIERLTWLMSTVEVVGGFNDNPLTIEDTDFFFTDDPVDMSESDVTGLYSDNIIGDCIQQSGANAYLFNAPTDDLDPIRLGLWYGRTERSDYASLHKISNVLADISPEALDHFDGVTPQYVTGYVFPPSLDATLERDPSRQITTAMVQYDGSYVVKTNAAITDIMVRRDMVFAAELVKTQAAALARANRYVDDLSEEDDAIECSVIVPGWLVNGFRPGHRVQFKNSYMPGYEDDYVWMRVAKITYRQLAGTPNPLYELAMDLRAETPPGPPTPEPPAPFTCEGGDYDATASAEYPRLGQEDGNAAGVHYYWNAGDDRPDVPTPFWTGGSWSFPVYDGSGDFNVSNLNFWSMIFVGPGTLTVHTVADSRGGGHTTATMWRASVSHFESGTPVEDFTQDGVPGVDEVITIPEDAGDDCIHVVTISCPEHSGPGGMGANGCTWVLG